MTDDVLVRLEESGRRVLVYAGELSIEHTGSEFMLVRRGAAGLIAELGLDPEELRLLAELDAVGPIGSTGLTVEVESEESRFALARFIAGRRVAALGLTPAELETLPDLAHDARSAAAMRPPRSRVA